MEQKQMTLNDVEEEFGLSMVDGKRRLISHKTGEVLSTNILKEFNTILYSDYQEYLLQSGVKRSELKDYMIFKRIMVRDINNPPYNNYYDLKSFRESYFMLMRDKIDGLETIEDAEKYFNSYYDCFKENMQEYLDWFMETFNQDEETCRRIYMFKTMYNHYDGFMWERTIKEALEPILYKDDSEDSDRNNFVIDCIYKVDLTIELEDSGKHSIQIKSLSFLNSNRTVKYKVYDALEKYENKFDIPTYLMFHEGQNIYYSEKYGYMIPLEEVKKIRNSNELKLGTIEGLLDELDI